MPVDLMALMVTAATIGVVHTLLGPDHYLPFLFLARARRWTRARTVAITLLCGLAHVLSSVVLGVIGIAAGIALSKLEAVESTRGEIAAWVLIAFGLVYAAWGIRRAHSHRLHPHPGREVTAWVLFLIFALGPCEPLIPLLLYPAATHSPGGIALVALVYGAGTLATMVFTVWFGLAGFERLRLTWLERYSHAVAGAGVALCGLAIRFLGL